ncbi:unnamed protein product [marine sediment metagenome]|uniref:Uncharacterized protein n=1 Tax=marine sediment metagenome TaxID=412755 RepID=X1U2U4_9ZZZZ
MVRTYNVEITGIAPLLHHRFTGEKTRGTGKEYVPAEEAKKALYLNKEDIPYLPANHLEGCMINAAKNFKFKGRKTYMDFFKAAILVEPREIPFKKPENPLEYVIDEQPVVINRARVLAWRPRWDEWQFEFKIICLQPDRISDKTLKDILEYGGMFVGIGDFRPKFGRFEFTKFDVVED